MDSKICANDRCGKSFEPNHGKQKFCSNKCKLQAFRKAGKQPLFTPKMVEQVVALDASKSPENREKWKRVIEGDVEISYRPSDLDFDTPVVETDKPVFDNMRISTPAEPSETPTSEKPFSEITDDDLTEDYINQREDLTPTQRIQLRMRLKRKSKNT